MLWSTASGPRNPEASIVSCTRCAKYSTARSVISDAFSWNPYGVSSKTARGVGSPRRATISRCGVTIVGAVSPEPMIARMRGGRALT